MPTKLVLPNSHVTPEEFIELLRYHFEQVPTEKIYYPTVVFTSCDADNNETVLFSRKNNIPVQNLKLEPPAKPHDYDGDLVLKTIIRDKSRVN